MEAPVSSLIRLLILLALAHSAPSHFLPEYFASTAYILAAPTDPLHHTVVLDSGSEARYVRRQGRGLGV